MSFIKAELIIALLKLRISSSKSAWEIPLGSTLISLLEGEISDIENGLLEVVTFLWKEKLKT